MAFLDWILVFTLGTGAVMGLVKGFFRQLASIVGLIAGLLVARALFGVVGERLAYEAGMNVTFGQVIAFVLIWLVVPLCLSLVASLCTKLFDVIHLGFVNRGLGAVLGIVKYALLAGMVIHFIEYIDVEDSLIKSTSKQTSVLYYPLEELSGIFYPVLKDVTKQLMETTNNIY